MLVGEVRVDPVVDGSGWFEPTKSFRGTTPEQWAVHRDLLDTEGRLGFSMGGFLVRHAGRVVLVDVGLGPREFLGIRGGAFLEELARLGVGPADVTDVVLTHLHFDHVGWASREGRAVFPAATYRCSAADWEWFSRHPGDEMDLMRPAEGQLELWDRDGPLLPGLDTLGAPGHTPGSTVLVVSSGGARAVLLGDVVHCPVELVDDEWDAMADVDPELARRTRVALNRELEGSGVPVAAAHFPGLRFGRLLAGDGRRRWVV
ncbi:MAG TPA: MBL fold metallo-hydrolase [Acidimicrobiales bacterium]|nr:MBL fold metallo-hydrolase [Acidimicrobiales bacterium]